MVKPSKLSPLVREHIEWIVANAERCQELADGQGRPVSPEVEQEINAPRRNRKAPQRVQRQDASKEIGS